MGCYSGPEIINDGLVFYYDMSNTQKSWKGKPLTNYYGDISTSSSVRTPKTSHFWDGYKWLTSGGYTHPGIDGPTGVYLGLVYKHTSGSLSSTWSGNSYGYTLKNIESTIGNTYTQSVWVYVSSDSDLTQLWCLTEGANNITVNGYNTEYNVSSKGTWQQLARSAVSDGNVRWIPIYPSKNGVINGTFTGFYMWGAVQVEDGTTVNKYAGDNVSYSRSSTQSILDLTGKKTITIANLSYSTNNTFTFDGTDDFLATGTPDLKDSNYSIQAWIKPYAMGRFNPIIGDLQYDWFGLYFDSSNKLVARHRNTDSIFVNLTYSMTDLTNKWCHISSVFDNNVGMHIYINGSLVANNTQKSNFSLAPPRGPQYVGRHSRGAPSSTDQFYGEIPSVQIYNRALTAQEIQQNFNATRGRYKI